VLTGVHSALTAVDPVDNAICLRLTGFVSFLHENGFAVGIDDAALLVEAANHIGILDKKLLRWSAQALLCRRAGDRQRFDELFDAWFLPPNKRQYVESRSGARASWIKQIMPSPARTLAKACRSLQTTMQLSPASPREARHNTVRPPLNLSQTPTSGICTSRKRCGLWKS